MLDFLSISASIRKKSAAKESDEDEVAELEDFDFLAEPSVIISLSVSLLLSWSESTSEIKGESESSFFLVVFESLLECLQLPLPSSDSMTDLETPF